MTVAQDIRYACRSLRSSRAYSIWGVGRLAIGMAVTIAALAVLNAVLLLPFPEVTEQQRLVTPSAYESSMDAGSRKRAGTGGRKLPW